MNAITTFNKSKIREILSQIPDPEIPVISITEMGIVRNIEMKGEKLIVTITPTYTGCPAMSHFENDILKILKTHGFENVEVETVYHPAWTTDWMSEGTREKLRQYGIAPPVKNSCGKVDFFAPSPVVACPICNSTNTMLKSQFGSTACKALYGCNDCLEPFEYFKCI